MTENEVEMLDMKYHNEKRNCVSKCFQFLSGCVTKCEVEFKMQKLKVEVHPFLI
jgi:hypothetical protein